MTVREIGHGSHRYIWDTADTKPTAATHGCTTGDRGYDRQTGIMYVCYDGTNWAEKDTVVRLETSPTIDIGDVTVKRVPVHTKTTGTTAAVATLTPGATFKMLEIRLHLGSALASAETLTVTQNATGAAYDTVLLSEDIGTLGAVDLLRTFGKDEGFFESTDSIVIALSANTGGDTWGCQTIHELI